MSKGTVFKDMASGGAGHYTRGRVWSPEKLK